MLKITAWQCKDGTLFQYLAEAKAHERDVAIKNQLTTFAENYCACNMRTEDVATVLVENQDMLRIILNGEA